MEHKCYYKRCSYLTHGNICSFPGGPCGCVSRVPEPLKGKTEPVAESPAAMAGSKADISYAKSLKLARLLLQKWWDEKKVSHNIDMDADAAYLAQVIQQRELP